MGSRASNKAAQTQAAAAQAAQDYLKQLLGEYNPKIGEAATSAATGVTDAASGARDYLSSVLAGNRSDVLGGVATSTDLLKPYLGLGTDAAASLSDLMKTGGDLNRNFSFEDIKNLDPGYQFRIDQANKAYQTSAAARGGALGGGALRALSNLSENQASAEAGAAFSRLNQQQNDRFSRLNSMLGLGMNAAGQTGSIINNANQYLASQGMQGADTLGNWMIQPAEYAGTMSYNAANTMANNAFNTGDRITDLMTGAANARAAGQVGSANAWSNALSGVGNAAAGVGKYYQGKDLLGMMQNPALSGNVANLPTATTPSYMRNYYGYPTG